MSSFHTFNKPPPNNHSANASFNLATNAAFKYEINHLKITANLNNPAEAEVANRAEDEIFQTYFSAYSDSHLTTGQTISDPLGGFINADTFLNSLNNVQLLITDDVLVGGAAGLTTYSATGGPTVIQISVPDTLAVGPNGTSYDQLSGGVEYVVGHELGHALGSGESVAATEVANYVNRTGDSSLSNYNDSQPEYQAKEAYANSLGLNIATTLGGVWLAPNQQPTDHYFTGIVG